MPLLLNDFDMHKISQNVRKTADELFSQVSDTVYDRSVNIFLDLKPRTFRTLSVLMRMSSCNVPSLAGNSRDPHRRYCVVFRSHQHVSINCA